jgi:hypothetical protein
MGAELEIESARSGDGRQRSHAGLLGLSSHQALVAGKPRPQPGLPGATFCLSRVDGHMFLFPKLLTNKGCLKQKFVS